MIIIGLQAPIAVYTVMLPGPLTLKESRAEIVASVAGAKSEKRRRNRNRRRHYHPAVAGRPPVGPFDSGAAF